MAEWSACQTPGFESSSGPLLDLFLVILSSNSQPQLKVANWLPPATVDVFNPVMFSLDYYFVSNYLSGVPVNQLESALFTVNKP